MPKLNTNVVHARRLLADLLRSPDILLPRRDTLMEWLNAFLLRAEAPAYALNADDTTDLTDLDQYLRDSALPAAPLGAA